MSQVKVILFLATHPDDWYNVKTLVKKVGTTRQTVSNTLEVLSDNGLLEEKPVKLFCSFVYRWRGINRLL